MPKVSQLAADSRTEIMWLLPNWTQFRVTGRAYIVPASGMGGSGRLSRSSSLQVSPSYKSPRNMERPKLRSTPSTSPDPSLSDQNPDAVVESPGILPDVNADPSGDRTPSASASANTSTPGSGTASGALSRNASTSSRPQLHLTPDVPSASGPGSGARSPKSPIISAPRSPRDSPPTSATSTGSYPQFHLRPGTPLNPAVTLSDTAAEGIALPSLAGTLSALVSWGVTPTAPESSPSWWEAERARIWENLSPELRASFARPAPPGTTLANAPPPEEWITRLESHAKNPEEAKSLTSAWDNFTVVALAPERVEMLELSCEPHRRACWVRDGDEWIKEEIVP